MEPAEVTQRLVDEVPQGRRQVEEMGYEDWENFLQSVVELGSEGSCCVPHSGRYPEVLVCGCQPPCAVRLSD